ncbi:MAG: hypothetical protein AB7P21_26680, partial [Lautropia sp.]
GCAERLRDAPLSHDNYFDTVLGLLRIDTDAYRADRDAFAGCREADAHVNPVPRPLGLAEPALPRDAQPHEVPAS